jgi:hypothetical protein
MTSQSVERGEGLIELKATALAPTHVADGDQDGIAKVLKRERLGPKAIKSLEQVTGQKVPPRPLPRAAFTPSIGAIAGRQSTSRSNRSSTASTSPRANAS